MPKGDNITTKFTVDISDLKSGINEANKNIKLANAEFKSASAGMDNWSKSTDGVKAKLTQLNTVLDNENKKLQSYKDQLKAVEDAKTKNAKKIDELKAKLQELSDKGVSKTSEEYKKYEKQLAEAEKEQLKNVDASDKLQVAVLNQQAVVNKTEKEIRNFEKSLADMGGEATEAEKKLKEFGDKIGGAVKKAVVAGTTAMAGAIAGVATSAWKLSKDVAQMGREVNLNSQKLGLSRQAYQEWDFILRKSGGSIDNMGVSMKTLQKTMDTANNGNKASIDSFNRLGISLDSVKNSSPESMMEQVIGKLQQMPNGAERTATALKLFGKNAMDLQPLLNRTAEETDELRKRAHDLGLVLSDDQINASAKFTGAMGRIKDTAQGLKIQLGTSLLPILSTLGEKAGEALQKVDMSKIIDALSTSVGGLADKAGGIIESVVPKLVDFIPKIINFATFIINNAGTIAGVMASFLVLTTIGKITASISSIIGLFTTLIPVLWAGATAGWGFIAPFLPIIGIIAGIIAVIAGVVLAVKNWGAIVDWFKGIWGAFVGWITGVFAPVGDFFKNLWSGVVNIFTSVWDNIKGIFQSAWDFILNLLTIVVGIPLAIINSLLVQPLIKLWTTLWNWIKEPIQFVFGLIKTIITTYINIWIKILTTLWNGITAIFEGIKSVIMTVWNAIVGFLTPIIDGIKKTITTVFEGIKNTITTIFNAIKTTISTVINTIKSTIDSVFNAIKSSVTNIWNGIKTAMTTPIQAGADLIKGIIEKIKGFFNFKISFPKIPMPHFGISPAGWKIGDLLQGKIPKLKIDWYAKGGYGVANKPVITPQGQGFGEAGREAFIPLSKKVLSSIGNAIVEATAVFSDNSDLIKAVNLQTEEIKRLQTAINTPLYLDSGELVGGIQSKIDKALGDINGYRLRGLAI